MNRECRRSRAGACVLRVSNFIKRLHKCFVSSSVHTYHAGRAGGQKPVQAPEATHALLDSAVRFTGEAWLHGRFTYMLYRQTLNR